MIDQAIYREMESSYLIVVLTNQHKKLEDYRFVCKYCLDYHQLRGL